MAKDALTRRINLARHSLVVDCLPGPIQHGRPSFVAPLLPEVQQSRNRPNRMNKRLASQGTGNCSYRHTSGA